MRTLRLAGIVVVAALATLTGGCAVYSTPSGEVIGPAPVVVSPPAVVVSPFPFYGGHSHYHAPRRYAPPYHAPRYHGRGAPRYYGRPYYRY